MFESTEVRGSTRAKLKVSEANEFDVDVLLKLPVDLNKRPFPIEVHACSFILICYLRGHPSAQLNFSGPWENMSTSWQYLYWNLTLSSLTKLTN